MSPVIFRFSSPARVDKDVLHVARIEWNEHPRCWRADRTPIPVMPGR